MARGRGIPQQPTEGAPRGRGRGRGRSRAARDTQQTMTGPSSSDQPQEMITGPSPSQLLQMPPYTRGSLHSVRSSTSPAVTSSSLPAQQHSTPSPSSAAIPSYVATTGQLRTSSPHISASSHSYDAAPILDDED